MGFYFDFEGFWIKLFLSKKRRFRILPIPARSGVGGAGLEWGLCDVWLPLSYFSWIRIKNPSGKPGHVLQKGITYKF